MPSHRSQLRQVLPDRPEAESSSDDFPIEVSVGYQIRATHRAFQRALQTRIASFGVTLGMWYFLRVLWIRDGLTQRELSQRIGMMEPTAVTALKSMEREGLIKRVRNPGDRRKVHIYLTARGRALRKRLLPFAREVNAVALEGLSPGEINTLRNLLIRMRSRLEADMAAPAAGELRGTD